MFDRYWNRVSDNDPRVVDLFSRHYSAAKNKKGRKDWLRTGIVGPGEKIALLTTACDALFVWGRSDYRNDGLGRIWCTVFRNESDALSSAMILEAEEWAWSKWPGETLHTFVSPSAVTSPNPGYCFKKAGWVTRKDYRTRKGLHVLEKCPPCR